jgi:hypothetical protein
VPSELPDLLAFTATTSNDILPVVCATLDAAILHKGVASTNSLGNVLIRMGLHRSTAPKCDAAGRLVGSEKHSQALSLIAEKSDEEAVKVA